MSAAKRAQKQLEEQAQELERQLGVARARVKELEREVETNLWSEVSRVKRICSGPAIQDEWRERMGSAARAIWIGGFSFDSATIVGGSRCAPAASGRRLQVGA